MRVSSRGVSSDFESGSQVCLKERGEEQFFRERHSGVSEGAKVQTTEGLISK